MIRRALTVLLIGSFLLWVVAVLLAWAFNGNPGLNPAPVLVLILPPGAPVDPGVDALRSWERDVALEVVPPRAQELAACLKKRRVIRSEWLFTAAARVMDLDGRLAAGWWRLEGDLSTWAILERLGTGRGARPVWVSPGESFAQVSGRFARTGLKGDLAAELERVAEKRPPRILPAVACFPPGLYLVDPAHAHASEIAIEALDRFDRGLGSFIRRSGLENGPWGRRFGRALALEGASAAVDPVAPRMRSILSSRDD
ncbi:MAG: endolytic transglycosylase MltG [Spirochaetes bacterium]|nr:endolytic transglycosylase MltG [Spirochaetota bacterium]